jgi:hypothetical protein
MDMVKEKNGHKVQTLGHLISSSFRMVNGADLAFGSCQRARRSKQEVGKEGRPCKE